MTEITDANDGFRLSPDTGTIVPAADKSQDLCKWIGPYGEFMQRARVTLPGPAGMYKVVTVDITPEKDTGYNDET